MTDDRSQAARRDLCQAVVDASRGSKEHTDAIHALSGHLGSRIYIDVPEGEPLCDEVAYVILAALNAERSDAWAIGYRLGTEQHNGRLETHGK